MPLSDGTIQKLNASMVDSGANFLVGAATNPFSEGFNQQSAGAMSMVGGAIGMASGAANIVGSGIQDAALTTTIAAEGLQQISQQITEVVAQATVKLMMIPMDKFTEAMNKEITECTFKPKEIIDKLTKGAEEFQKGVAEEVEKQSKEKLQNNATSKFQEISYNTTKWMQKAQEQLNTIASYTAKGPEWMQKKVDECSYLITTQVQGSINKVVEDFDKVKNTWAENAGKAAAKKVVVPINNKLVAAQKKIMDKIEETKTKAMGKAKAGVAQAIMKLKGLLGG